MVVNKKKQSEFLKSLDRKKKQEKQLEKQSKKLNNQQKKKNEQKKKQSGGDKKKGSGNRGTKQTSGCNAFGGAYGYGNGGGNTTVGSFGGFGHGTSKSGGISLKPAAAETFSNKLSTVSGRNEKSSKNSLDEIYGRILDKRYREYLAEQKRRREAEKPKYRNNTDYVKGVSAENVKKAKAELGSILDSFKDGKLPSQKNVSQGDLDNALKNIDNFHALGVGDYGFDEEASENLQHTANAWAKGSVSRLYDLGLSPFSNVDRMTGRYLRDNFEVMDNFLSAKEQASENYNEELDRIDSEFLKVMGDVGYYIPDIIAAYLTRGKSLEKIGGELLTKNAVKAGKFLDKKLLGMMGLYGSQYLDSNLESGMDAPDAVSAAVCEMLLAFLINKYAGKSMGTAVSDTDKVKSVAKSGSIGMLNSIGNSAAVGMFSEDMPLFDDGSGRPYVFNVPKTMEAFIINMLKNSVSSAGKDSRQQYE